MAVLEFLVQDRTASQVAAELNARRRRLMRAV